jgi:hypothetical protein
MPKFAKSLIFLALCGGAWNLLPAREAQADDYWDGYWQWYDQSYRPYQQRVYSSYPAYGYGTPYYAPTYGYGYGAPRVYYQGPRYSGYSGPAFGYRSGPRGTAVRVGPVRFGWR